ncbi:MAG TPA: class F sortase [Nocardioides sp.]|nr:class F sortase [Nocardioides sp.]
MRHSAPVTLTAVAVLLGGCGGAGSGATSSTDGEHPSAAGETSAGAAAVAKPAPSQVRAEPPVSVTFPSGRVLPVDPAETLPDGALAVPQDIHRAGWWTGSSRLGDPFGSVVLAAHVDSFSQGVGPAAELLSARPGDTVRLTGRHLAQKYVITSVRLVPQADLRRRSVVFSAAGDRRLVLITCGGTYDASLGGYQDNVVVVARPAKR